MKHARILSLSLIVPFFLGCDNDPLDVNISTEGFQAKFHRIDIDLFSQAEKDTIEWEDHGEFMRLYGQYVLELGYLGSPGFKANLRGFVNDHDMRELYEEAQSVYPNSDDLQTDFSEAFARYQYYFPDSVTPQIIGTITGLNYAVFTGDSTLGIGLDMFLGRDFDIYPMIGIPRYMSNTMTPEHLVSQSMYGWIQSMYEDSADGGSMLDQMIFHGSILYSLDAILRNTADSLKIGYSSSELDWTQEREEKIWATMVDNELLYNSDHLTISKWIEPGPFTSGLPDESPGKLGRWIGWQIVRKYMKNQSEVNLPELFRTDAQTILRKSKYKPK